MGGAHMSAHHLHVRTAAVPQNRCHRWVSRSSLLLPALARGAWALRKGCGGVHRRPSAAAAGGGGMCNVACALSSRGAKCSAGHKFCSTCVLTTGRGGGERVHAREASSCSMHCMLLLTRRLSPFPPAQSTSSHTPSHGAAGTHAWHHACPAKSDWMLGAHPH